ncbi:MAG: hypothetical protein E7253_01465 [Lachnospiraceae bacterium]|nr:hypothetical protein [Lachnospiraceae bacterium]
MNTNPSDFDEIYKDEIPPATANTEIDTDKKCPSCGGTMDYNPAMNNMTCPYCGYEEAIQVTNESFVAEELDFNQAENDEACDWGTATRTVICKACGAETVYDFNHIASECPYCGSNQIMEQETQVNVMAPGGVVPFQLDAKAAAGRFKSWIKGQFFCPKQAKESAKPKSFTGMYLPFWTFDSQTSSSYTGQYGITRHRRTRDGKTVAETQWHHTSGHYSLFLDDVLVCGSTRQNEQMLRQIEPFDTGKVVEYKPEYLAGFTAERYTIKVKAAWETAKDKIASILKRNIESKIEREHGTSQTRFVQVNTTHRNVTYKYILLPVWISSFKYNGKVYHFMINGQTGKVSGQAPISWLKVLLTAAALIAFFLLIHTMMNADAAVTAHAQELSRILFTLI